MRYYSPIIELERAVFFLNTKKKWIMHRNSINHENRILADLKHGFRYALWHSKPNCVSHLFIEKTQNKRYDVSAAMLLLSSVSTSRNHSFVWIIRKFVVFEQKDIALAMSFISWFRYWAVSHHHFDNDVTQDEQVRAMTLFNCAIWVICLHFRTSYH